MESQKKDKPATVQSKTTAKSSPVKAMISWLVKTDREFRVAQTMVNDTYNKL